MRYKVAPPARDVAFLERAADALPLIPGTVDDCCASILEGTDLSTRDEAREVLTFLTALGLAADTDRGYHRVADPPDRDGLARRFRENVFAASEVIEAVEAGARTPEAVFAAVEPEIPAWERSRHADWTAAWRERVTRLLGWAVTLECLGTTDGEYRPI